MSKVSSILSAFHALAIAITLASCEKVAIPESDASEELNGNLRVSVYQIEQTPFAGSTRTTEAASVACTRLNFAIYDEDGSRLKQINQQSSADDFGSVAFQLDDAVSSSPTTSLRKSRRCGSTIPAAPALSTQ